MDAQSTTIDDIWKDDLLNRKSDAEFLRAFLLGKMTQRQSEGIQGSYVLNIDAEWGAGKTFFLKRFGEHLKEKDHLVVDIDAWRDDYVDDPFVAVLSAIDATLKPYIKQTSGFKKYIQHAKKNASSIILNAGKGALKAAAKRYLDSEITELIKSKANDTAKPLIEGAVEAVNKEIDKLTDKFTDEIISKFTQQNKASNDFKVNLGTALKILNERTEIKLPLFILIDELDRCRPTYAVALLERIKHLFDIENIVFVFATNSGQLQHSITGAYGPSFDGYRYLKRFFDTTYKLESESVYAFIRMYFEETKLSKFNAPGNENSNVNVMNFIVHCADCYNLTLRDIRQVLDILDIVLLSWPHNTPIDLLILFPLTVYYFKTGDTDFNAVLSSIPDSIKMYDGHDRMGEAKYVSIKSTFELFMTATESEGSIKDFLKNELSSISYGYVRKYLVNENRQRNRYTKPFVFTLPSLIKRAGQMSEKSLTYS